MQKGCGWKHILDCGQVEEFVQANKNTRILAAPMPVWGMLGVWILKAWTQTQIAIVIL